MTRVFSRAETIFIAFGVALAASLLFSGLLLNAARFISAAFVVGMVAWIMWRDVSDFTIPDGPLVCIGLVGAANRMAESLNGPADAILLIGVDGCVCGGVLLAMREGYFRLRGVDGIGFGDVKLAAVAGILVGMVGFAWALFLASAAGLVVALLVNAMRPRTKLDRLPFGAFLAPVCCAMWLLDLVGRI